MIKLTGIQRGKLLQMVNEQHYKIGKNSVYQMFVLDKAATIKD
jgi:hypothetical protein